MDRCGSCRNWKLPHRSDGGFGYCTAIDKDYSHEIDGTKPDRAYTKDGSGFYSALMCSSDFGCVKWEEKDED